jgi:hypothetical protein
LAFPRNAGEETTGGRSVILLLMDGSHLKLAQLAGEHHPIFVVGMCLADVFPHVTASLPLRPFPT